MLTSEQYQKLKEAGYSDLQIRIFDATRESEQSEQKSNFGQRTKEAFKAGVEKTKQGFQEAGAGKKNPISTGLKMGAGLIEAGFSPITAAAEPVIRPTVGKLVEKAADKISDIPAVQKFATSKAGEFTSRRAEDVANLAEIAGTIGGSKSLIGQIPKVANKITGGIGGGIDKTLKPVQKATQAVTESTSPIIGEIKRLPSRFSTNMANKRAIQETINQLPTKVAREAAQDGLDVTDIKTLYKIPKDQKVSLKKLAVNVKEFSEGNTKVNPIEVVGKPIVNRLKELEAERIKIGTELGDVADNLGVVTKEELLPTVFQRLKKVSGLEDLTIDNNGILNFRNTVLATAETAADRNAIQRIFNSATKWGQGKNKHLLRQELFESLGGKKRASLNLTATQERAYEAIRQGLSDVLETKNQGYKALSNQYRQIINPLKEMRKMMKVAGEAEDILDMSAGLLGRRVTSLAASNPQIKAILNAMDKATKKTGQTRLSIETLQDFYNILEKYYDIAPKTGFQAQVRQGVEKAVGGPINYIAEQIKGFAGETPAVRQKALERILDEILK